LRPGTPAPSRAQRGRLTPDPREVRVWCVNLSPPPHGVSRLLTLLSDDERKRADRFCFADDRRRFIVARGTLRIILGRSLDMPAERIEIAEGPQGKPYVVRSGRSKGIQFNLSHADDLALVAVGWEREVGVDVERVRGNIPCTALARRFFAPEEVAALQALPPRERVAAFFRCWTRKEAYLKAIGVGLSVPLNRFAVSLEAGKARLIRPGVEGAEPRRWSLRDIEVPDGYAAALVVEGTGWRLTRRDWHAGSTDPG